MSDIRLHAIEMLYLLWALPLLFALFLYGASRRRHLRREQMTATECQSRLLTRFTLDTWPAKWIQD